MENYKAHILVVDDDDGIRELVKQFLNQNNYLVTTAKSSEDALEKVKIIKFDLIVLDIMMPGKSGLEFTNENKKKLDTPIILLTAKGEASERVEGLEIGADDYLSKPFEPEELYLRIKKLLILYKDNVDKKTAFVFGNFVFNTSTLQLKKDSNDIYLTEGETELLLKLIYKRNNIVLREELVDRDFDENELRKVDVQVTRLRQKIEENPKQPHFIKTIRGKGYKLVCDEL